MPCGAKDIMVEYIIIAVIVAVIAVAVLRKPFTPPPSTHANPQFFKFYEAAPSLFVNAPERVFFQMLSRALPDDYVLLVKPRLEDIIRVKRDLPNPKLRWQLRARVKSRHVDFAIMHWDGTPIMGIELDGRSHDAAKASAGDALKDGIFRAARLPLRRIQTGEDFAKHIVEITYFLKSP